MELENSKDNQNSIPKVRMDISIPGLERLADHSSGKKRKYIWLVLILLCSIACIYLTIDRLIHFFNVPLALKVEIKRLDDITFPVFTVCSSNLRFGLKEAVKLKAQKQCKAFSRSDCESEIENIPFRDLNFTLDDVWKQYALTNIELILMGTNKPVNVADYVFSNKTSDTFNFSIKNTFMGSCIVIKHKTTVPYISVATELKMIIRENNIDPSRDLHYTLMPHDRSLENVSTFEFLTHEFEIFGSGYGFKLKLHEEKFSVKNISGRLCYNREEELQAIDDCASQVTDSTICRLDGFPNTFLKCDCLKDIPDNDDLKYFEKLNELSKKCRSRNSCIDTQHIINIDDSIGISEEITEDVSDITILKIRLSDDTIHVVDEYLNYTFPDLVSDLFAYWSFFLNLSALVFFEIFEYFFKTIHQCLVRKSTK